MAEGALTSFNVRYVTIIATLRVMHIY